MDSNDFNDEIEELDENPNTTQEMSDSEFPEDYLDGGYEESYNDSYNRAKFGEREYKNAKDENGRHDKDYYKKRGQELDEKVNKAKEEKDRDWKTEKKDDEQNKKNDNKESTDKNQDKENVDDTNKNEENKSKNSETKEKDNLKHKPEEERQNKNKFDKLKDNINLEKAKFERMQNKLDGIKARTYQTMHPVEAAKEEAKEKAKDVAKATGKAAAKGATKAAKATGRMVAAGGKAAIAFLASNPIVLAALAVIIILFIILFMLFSNPSDEDLDSLGYFDTTCDFNLTTVIYSCPPYETNNKEMSLKDYVIGVAYGESEEENFSEAAIKALMIIVKTNALAEGNYDSSGDKIVRLNTCNVLYEDVYEEIEDEEENEAKKDKVKILEQYYNEINNFLFISDSYKSEITDLGKEDALEYNDNIIKKLTETDKNSYEEILKEIYAINDDEQDEVITVENDKPYLFIGDSRTVQMKGAVSELTDNNTVAKGSMGYSWFESTAVSSANAILSQSDEAYNIVSWMGVNDAATRSTVNNYFNKYKELAEGQWSKHTIYVVSIGPVGPNYSYTNQYGTITSKELNEDIDYFNSTMEKSITNANISNLKFIRLNYNISTYDNSNLHYSNEDSKTIFSDIISKIYKSKTISKEKSLFDNKEYCTYYNYNNGCEAGWWWPVGTKHAMGNIYPEEPDSTLTNIYSYFSKSRDLGQGAKPHKGVDIGGDFNDIVIASRSGTVTTVNNYCPTIGYLGSDCGYGGGNAVYIKHDDGTESRYLHMTKDSIVVKVGQKVSQGQKIGLIGSSGSSTGAHLHFEVLINGVQVDPLKGYISTENTRPTGNCNNKEYTADKEGICLALKDQGFSDNAVAGLMANIYREGIKPTAYTANDNGGPSFGLIGWHDEFICRNVNVCEAASTYPTRTCNGSKLQCFCQQNNMEWDTLNCQIAYIKKYIDDYANSPGYDAAKEVYGDYSAYEIGKAFCAKLERCTRCLVYDSNGNVISGLAGPACYERGSIASDMLTFVTNGCKE